MAKSTKVERTVQYWRLVDARDGSLVDEVNWDQVLRGLSGSRETFTIDFREHAGTVYPITVDPKWRDSLNFTQSDSVIQPANAGLTHGFVIAAGKDFVPNQENTSSGRQMPMGLAGEEWEPVDNLFVWMLPFGNIIGVLAESVSSSRASKFADWLTRATKGSLKKDPEFAWAARPVIDQTRVDLLKDADGLSAVAYAGEMGAGVVDASGVRSLFVGPKKVPGAIRIEIKASTVRGKSTPEDSALILEWFNTNFGSLDGSVNKAQVTIAAHDDLPPTEIDLLHHRLTRKTNVQVANGTTRAFTPLSALGAIINAFVLDREDLIRLRKNTD